MLRTRGYLIVLAAAVVAAMDTASCGQWASSIDLSNSASPVAEEMVDIVVRLRPDIAPLFHIGGDQAVEAMEVTAVLKQFGVDLRPQHPGASDPELQSYFTISGVSSTAEAERIAAALRKLDAVEAAYVQPLASPA
jgi:hypothetical protein